MTVDFDAEQDDVRATLANLRGCDVSHHRAQQLRRRCHSVLQAEPSPMRSAWRTDQTSFRRFVLPALGAAWCLAYLAEMIRCAAAIYAHFGTQ